MYSNAWAIILLWFSSQFAPVDTETDAFFRIDSPFRPVKLHQHLTKWKTSSKSVNPSLHILVFSIPLLHIRESFPSFTLEASHPAFLIRSLIFSLLTTFHPFINQDPGSPASSLGVHSLPMQMCSPIPSVCSTSPGFHISHLYFPSYLTVTSKVAKQKQKNSLPMPRSLSHLPSQSTWCVPSSPLKVLLSRSTIIISILLNAVTTFLPMFHSVS